jgi:hypothetical protein
MHASARWTYAKASAVVQRRFRVRSGGRDCGIGTVGGAAALRVLQRSYLEPLLEKQLTTRASSADIIVDWATGLRFGVYDLDPRRYDWLIGKQRLSSFFFSQFC